MVSTVQNNLELYFLLKLLDLFFFLKELLETFTNDFPRVTAKEPLIKHLCVYDVYFHSV